jgi:hypothetical protein
MDIYGHFDFGQIENIFDPIKYRKIRKTFSKKYFTAT